MGKIFSYILFCVLNITVHSQITFEKSFSAFPGCIESYGICVCQTHDNGYAILTRAKVNRVDHSILIKTNSNCEITQTKLLDGIATFFNKTHDDGFIYTGSLENRLMMLKTDSTLNNQWFKAIKSEQTNGVSVCQTIDNGYCFIGMHFNYMSNATLIVLRTNEYGDTLWTKYFGGSTTSLIGQSIIQTNDSGFVICGSITDGPGGPSKVFIMRLNSLGDSLWMKTYHYSLYDYGYVVFSIENSGYLAICTSENIVNESNPDFVYLIRTDKNGDTLWTKIFGANSGQGLSATKLTGGGYVLVATKRDTISNTLKIFLVRINETGEILWSKVVGRPGEEWGISIKQTVDNGIVVCGMFASLLSSDTLNVFVVKTDSVGQNFPDPVPATNLYPDIMIFPNPVIDQMTIRINKDILNIEIFNIQGKVIFSDTNPEKQEKIYQLSLYNQLSGIYLIKFQAKNTIVYKKLIKM